MTINGKTTVCCVIGNPIAHSLSPTMHNAAYKALGLNFVFVPFQVENVEIAIKGIKALHLRGVSITLPHKQTVVPFLDEVDEMASQIGAINTIVNENGRLKGYNTDVNGAMQALEEEVILENKRALLIGAGGAARAIAHGLKGKKATITIANRSLEKGKALAQEVKADFVAIADIKNTNEFDVLINATSVGMQADKAVIAKELLQKNLTVFDIVYNPKETRLLHDAKEVGCKIIYGYKMLLYQGVLQFELFTGKIAPIKIMEQVLLQALERNI